MYACTSAPFGEAVTIAASVEMYGGFDCAKGWAWAPEWSQGFGDAADQFGTPQFP